jgi:hypothetical protein
VVEEGSTGSSRPPARAAPAGFGVNRKNPEQRRRRRGGPCDRSGAGVVDVAGVVYLGKGAVGEQAAQLVAPQQEASALGGPRGGGRPPGLQQSVP